MESNAWGTTSPSVLAVFILITPRCCRGCYPNKHPSLILEFSGSAVRLATPEPPGEVSGLPMPPVAARQNAGHRSAPCLSNRNACHLAPLTKGGRLLLCRSFPSLLSPARAGLFFSTARATPGSGGAQHKPSGTRARRQLGIQIGRLWVALWYDASITHAYWVKSLIGIRYFQFDWRASVRRTVICQQLGGAARSNTGWTARKGHPRRRDRRPRRRLALDAALAAGARTVTRTTFIA
jgi:hypothetical protein